MSKAATPGEALDAELDLKRRVCLVTFTPVLRTALFPLLAQHSWEPAARAVSLIAASQALGEFVHDAAISGVADRAVAEGHAELMLQAFERGFIAKAEAHRMLGDFARARRVAA